MEVMAIQGDTLDALCYRHLGVTGGMVEQALALNPGISLHGPHLPMGLLVQLPEPPSASAATAERPLIQLWD